MDPGSLLVLVSSFLLLGSQLQIQSNFGLKHRYFWSCSWVQLKHLELILKSTWGSGVWVKLTNRNVPSLTSRVMLSSASGAETFRDDSATQKHHSWSLLASFSAFVFCHVKFYLLFSQHPKTKQKFKKSTKIITKRKANSLIWIFLWK